MGFEQAGLSLRPHMEVNQIHSVLSLVEVNAGLAVLHVYAFMPCTVAALCDAR